MPRAIWTGAISFGMVTVPVRLFSAVNRKTVRFHQLSRNTGARILQRRVDSVTSEETPYEEIVKGYELAPDRYVVVEPAELDALAPEKTRTIEIEDFVELAQIDPIFYDHPYYLAPGPGESTLGTAALVDSEGEPGHHRCDRAVEIVAVERQPRLEPQRIAGAEADRLHPFVGNQPVGDRLGGDRRHRNLEAVLAGIARAADPQGMAKGAERSALHERQVSDTGNDGVEHLGSARPLQREQRLLLHMIDDQAVGELGHPSTERAESRRHGRDAIGLVPPRVSHACDLRPRLRDGRHGIRARNLSRTRRLSRTDLRRIRLRVSSRSRRERDDRADTYEDGEGHTNGNKISLHSLL